MRFFELARKVKFKNARLAAFGSTRRAHTAPCECPNVQALLEAQTPTVTIFGKSWDFHVREILKVSLKENLSMIGETVAYLKSKKKGGHLRRRTLLRRLPGKSPLRPSDH